MALGGSVEMDRDELEKITALIGLRLHQGYKIICGFMASKVNCNVSISFRKSRNAYC